MPADTTMPFGKHKGKPMSEVPSDYLEWMLRKNILKGGLKRLAQELVTGVKPPPEPTRTTGWIGTAVITPSDECPFDVPEEIGDVDREFQQIVRSL